MQKSKLTLYTAFLLLALTVTGTGQTITEKVDFGFRLGPSFGSATGHKNEVQMRTGFLAGAFLNYKENRLFTIQLELLYTGKGYRIKDVIQYDSLDNIIAQSDVEFVFNYIEAPLLAKIIAPMEGKYIPYLIGGGFVAYNVDNKMRLLEGLPLDFDIENADDVDFGAIIGIGMDMKSGRGKLFFETRYDMSFGKPIKNQNQKLRTLAIHFGYGW